VLEIIPSFEFSIPVQIISNSRWRHPASPIPSLIICSLSKLFYPLALVLLDMTTSRLKPHELIYTPFIYITVFLLIKPSVMAWKAK